MQCSVSIAIIFHDNLSPSLINQLCDNSCWRSFIHICIMQCSTSIVINYHEKRCPPISIIFIITLVEVLHSHTLCKVVDPCLFFSITSCFPPTWINFMVTSVSAMQSIHIYSFLFQTVFLLHQSTSWLLQFKIYIQTHNVMYSIHFFLFHDKLLPLYINQRHHDKQCLKLYIKMHDTMQSIHIHSFLLQAVTLLH